MSISSIKVIQIASVKEKQVLGEQNSNSSFTKKNNLTILSRS